MNGRKYFLGVLFMLFIKCISICCHLVLSISPVGKAIVTYENKDLNLTCKVTSEERLSEEFNLTWTLPSKRGKVKSDVSFNEHTIFIPGLQEDDSGQYICELNYKGIVKRKKISVYVESKKCKSPSFDCGNNLCISRNFVCDGHVDCPSGFDESLKHCGPDACHGKILCDGRCIPREFCCDATVDVNCTINYVMPCCYKVLSPTVELMSTSQCSASDECRYSQMFGFGNSMLYIVTSCAIVVMLVSSIFMIIICRICARQTDDFQRWRPGGATDRNHQCESMINHMDVAVDTLMDEDCPLDDSVNYMLPSICSQEQSEDFVLLNFVPGCGFEIAECMPPKPPPYSERTLGIPPPPYTSRVDLSSEVSIIGTEPDVVTAQVVSNAADS